MAAGLTNTLDSHGHPSTAPLSIANSFEIFMDGSSFYNAGNGSLPAVIMRGLPDGVDHGFSRVPYVYIIRFEVRTTGWLCCRWAGLPRRRRRAVL